MEVASILIVWATGVKVGKRGNKEPLARLFLMENASRLSAATNKITATAVMIGVRLLVVARRVSDVSVDSISLGD
jgi:hypothetical protein